MMNNRVQKTILKTL